MMMMIVRPAVTLGTEPQIAIDRQRLSLFLELKLLRCIAKIVKRSALSEKNGFLSLIVSFKKVDSTTGMPTVASSGFGAKRGTKLKESTVV